MVRRVKKSLVGVVAVAALAAGGSAIAGAASSSGSTTATTATTTQTQPQAPPNMPAHGTKSHEDAEKPVTGAAAAKVQAAAVKAVGSGTAGDVTTDYFGNGYEVTVTKADGSTVELHLDSSFTVLRGPGPGGQHGPPPAGAIG